VYEYEIWVDNCPRGKNNLISIFVNNKEYLYEKPDENFEIYLNNGVVIRCFDNRFGIVDAAGKNVRVFWDGDIEHVTFKSYVEFQWVVIIPIEIKDNTIACIENE